MPWQMGQHLEPQMLSHPVPPPAKHMTLQDVLDSHLITNIRGSHAANPDRDSAVLFYLCPHTIDLHSGETEAPIGNAESQIIIVVGKHV